MSHGKRLECASTRNEQLQSAWDDVDVFSCTVRLYPLLCVMSNVVALGGVRQLEFHD